MKKEKKAQITLIIILIIIILFSVISYVIISSREDIFPDKYKTNSDVRTVYESIDDCVKQRSIDAIFLIGLQGGYINLGDDFITTPYSDVMYGAKNKKNIFPKLDAIEKEIKEYLDYSLQYCINKDYFQDSLNVIIETTDPESDVTIFEDYVKINVNMPVYIIKEDETYELDQKYEEIILVRLGKLHRMANQIINEQIKNNDNIPIAYLSDFETKIIFDYYDNDTLLYIIHDENSIVEDTKYSLLFAVELK